MEFMNLADVTKLDEVPEGASVLAATSDGDIVRIPGEGLGGIAFFDVEVDAYGDMEILSCPSFAEIDTLRASGQFLIAVIKAEAHGAVSSTFMPLVHHAEGAMYVFACEGGGTFMIPIEGEPSISTSN